MRVAAPLLLGLPGITALCHLLPISWQNGYSVTGSAATKAPTVGQVMVEAVRRAAGNQLFGDAPVQLIPAREGKRITVTFRRPDLANENKKGPGETGDALVVVWDGKHFKEKWHLKKQMTRSARTIGTKAVRHETSTLLIDFDKAATAATEFWTSSMDYERSWEMCMSGGTDGYTVFVTEFPVEPEGMMAIVLRPDFSVLRVIRHYEPPRCSVGHFF